MKHYLLLLFVFPLSTFGQITIGNVEKYSEEKIEVKPTPYDSLKNFTEQEKLSDYKMYVGLKFYKPPFDNSKSKIANGGKYNFRKYTYHSMFNDSLIELKLGKSILVDEGSVQSFEKIYTYCYKPQLNIGSNNEAYITTNQDQISDKYFTVVNVLIDEEVSGMYGKLKSNIASLRKERNANDMIETDRDNFYVSRKNAVVFKLADDNTKETFYVRSLDNFVLVPYFVKQQQLFNNKKFIALIPNNNYEDIDYARNEKIRIEEKSIWNCEVTLLSETELGHGGSNYFIAYKMTNEKRQTLILKSLKTDYLYTFKLLDDYNKEESEKKLQQQFLLAERKKNEQIEKDNISKKHTAFVNKCIKLYGVQLGELISQNKVAIGMNAEMCELAWGKPYDKSLTIVESKTFEHWNYSWRKSLHFENGILKRIEN